MYFIVGKCINKNRWVILYLITNGKCIKEVKWSIFGIDTEKTVIRYSGN